MKLLYYWDMVTDTVEYYSSWDAEQNIQEHIDIHHRLTVYHNARTFPVKPRNMIWLDVPEVRIPVPDSYTDIVTINRNFLRDLPKFRNLHKYPLCDFKIEDYPEFLI